MQPTFARFFHLATSSESIPSTMLPLVMSLRPIDMSNHDIENALTSRAGKLPSKSFNSSSLFPWAATEPDSWALFSSAIPL